MPSHLPRKKKKGESKHRGKITTRSLRYRPGIAEFDAMVGAALGIKPRGHE